MEGCGKSAGRWWSGVGWGRVGWDGVGVEWGDGECVV